MKKLFTLLIFAFASILSFGQATGIFPKVTASGTDIYTTPCPSGSSCASYVNDGRYHIYFTNVNTVTNPTVAIGSLPTKTIYNSAGQALTAGELTGERVLVYNTVLNGFRVLGAGGSGGGGDAQTSDPLSQFAPTTSAQFAGVITNETGSGLVVLATSPSLTTPNLGTPTTLILTNATGLPVTTGISGLASGIATFLTTPSSANFATAITDETGSGSVVFSNSPTLSGTPQTSTASVGADNTQIASTEFVQGEKALQINSQTDSYTAILTDAFKLVDINKATSVNFTVPTNASVSFDVGTIIYLRQSGAGVLTVVASGGVTITGSAGTLTAPSQNSVFYIIKTATDTWSLQNGVATNAVPTSRTIAGLDLTTNRSASEININLASILSNPLTGSTNDRYFGTPLVYGSPSTTSLTVNVLRASPIYIQKNQTADRIQAEVTTLGASAVFRLCIYTDNGSGYPSSLVADSGQLDGSSTGVKNATISASLTGGNVYWLAHLTGTATTVFRSAVNQGFSSTAPFGWPSAMGATIREPYWTVSQSYGACPSSFPASGTINNGSTNMPLVLIRYQ